MTASGPTHRGYRGPRRLLVVSGVLFVVSVLVAVAAFNAIQTSGAAGIGMDLVRPAVNALLSVAGVDEIRVPPVGDSGTGWLTVAVFVIAFLAAGINFILLACGAGWLLMRRASRDYS